MLCRECHNYYDCVHQYFKSDSHSLRCPPADYLKILFTREMLFEIFSFRHFLSSCIQWNQDDANWIVFYRDQYREIYDTLIDTPEQDCLGKVIELYEQLDLFCKDECGVNFFYFGKRTEETVCKKEFFRRTDNVILGDWEKHGDVVWASLSKAQNERMLKEKEDDE